MGRPSKYTPELVAEICERLSKGEPQAVICRDEDMPDVSTVWRWKEEMPEVSQSIARARDIGFDAIAAQCLTIADDGTLDTYLDADGKERNDNDVVARSKLRVETRLKLLAKWCPKRYGDQIEVHHGITKETLEWAQKVRAGD